MAKGKVSGLIQPVISKIKRINERRAEIKRGVKAGKIPRGVLNNWDVAFDRIATDAGVMLTKSGNIPHSMRAAENIDLDALDGLLHRRTAGEIKKDIKAGVINEYGETPSAADMEDFTNDMSYVYEQLADNYDEMYDAFKAAFQGVKGKKTYKQLKTAIDDWKAMTEPQREEAMQRAVDRMFS